MFYFDFKHSSHPAICSDREHLINRLVSTGFGLSPTYHGYVSRNIKSINFKVIEGDKKRWSGEKKKIRERCKDLQRDINIYSKRDKELDSQRGRESIEQEGRKTEVEVNLKMINSRARVIYKNHIGVKKDRKIDLVFPTFLALIDNISKNDKINRSLK